MTLYGVGASAGIGIGKAALIQQQGLDYSWVQFSGRQEEKRRFQEAAKEFSRKNGQLAQYTKRHVGESEAEILTGQVTMLNDPFLVEQIYEKIEGGSCAEAAVSDVCSAYAELFLSSDDELMQQRATDIRDVCSGLLAILLGVKGVDLNSLPAGSVLVAKDLTPSMAVGICREKIAAVLTEQGGKASHSAIITRALGIPAVLGIPGLMERAEEGQIMIVDGDKGSVTLCPEKKELDFYYQEQKRRFEQRENLQAYRARPTQGADGALYRLYANINSAAEAAAARENGADGIGLFRTEFLFLDRSSLPTEEDQYQAYCQVAETMQGKEVVIRTLDVGGDKAAGYLGIKEEQNPFLGYRGIRYCLDHPELFQLQLRAILRAGARYSNIKMMFPLITGLEEVQKTKALLEQCKAELAAENLSYRAAMSVGVMIETPAAVQIADLLAQEADFFSIGTNDLTQYIMAVDRGNAKVETLYQTCHPAVLRSIRQVVDSAKRAGITVGMCGEAAADPYLLPLFIAFGVDELSVNPSQLLKMKKYISLWDREKAGQVAQKVMGFSQTAQIKDYLKAMGTYS